MKENTRNITNNECLSQTCGTNSLAE